MSGEISLNKEDRLYGISTIPLVIISVSIALYYSFAHFAYLQSQVSVMWDLLWNLVVPMLGIAPTSFFITYEILTIRKEKPAVLHVKRFFGRMVILFVTLSLLILVYLGSYFLLAPLISERFAVLVSLLVWLIVLIVGVARFKVLFDKLGKGSW